MLTKENIKDIYRVSPMQEGMYYHFLDNPSSSSAYLEQFSYKIRGKLDINIVEKSLNEILRRHDILRTLFNHEKTGQVLQVVLKDRKIGFAYHDLRSVSDTEEKHAWLLSLKFQDRNFSFDLNKDVLMRVMVVQLEDNEFVFFWTHHHILLDGWSVGILTSEYQEIYNAYVEGRNYSLPKVIQYRSYIDWLGKQNKEESREYWKLYLKDYEKVAELPTIYKGQENGYRNKKYALRLDSDKTKKLKDFATRNKITLNTIIQSIWGVVLAKYNDCRDVVYGTVVSGRPSDLAGSISMVGLFINTIPLRVQFDKGMKLETLLEKVHNEAAESEPYHYSHLAEVQATSELKNKLINNLLVFENYPVAEHLEKITNINSNNENSEYGINNLEVFEQTNYDLNLIVSVGNNVLIQFQYNASTYSTGIIEKVGQQIESLLDQILDQPGILVDQLQLITIFERDKILNEFNNTSCPFPDEVTLHELFEQQVSRTPYAIALEFKNTLLTFEEVNQRANQIAHCLKERFSIGAGDVVGLIMERSEQMTIGILGILKSGAAYLPIDPKFPKERVQYTLIDSGLKLVLVDEHQVPVTDKLEKVDILLIKDCTNYNCQNLDISYNPKSLAYIIYTSGSSGRPKGVMVEHRGVVNRIHWMWNQYQFNEGDVIFQKTPYVFDVSVWEFFMTLCFGAKLIICPDDVVYDPDRIIEFVHKYKITTIHFVASMLNTFLDFINNNSGKLSTLRRVITSGEALLSETVKRYYDYFNIPLYNLYGPTEASVDVSYYETVKGDLVVPIGKPISNIELLILDQNLSLMPIGAPGEIWIAGIGLARGYINKEELTNEKFILHPFRNGEKMYRTGDLGRWLPDGNIEFLGRRDNQVKIRGNRIELGEIENVILKIPGVEDAVVTAKQESSSKYLIGYLKAEINYSSSELREFLLQYLPEYMVPSFFVILNEFPKTASGKIDRNILQNPLNSRINTSFVAAGNEVEKKLVTIWEEVFEGIAVGVTDKFFDLGGHSLKAIKLSALISKEFKVKIKLTDILQKNIRELSVLILQLDEHNNEELYVIEEQEYYDASHGQKGLYLKQKYKKEKTSFNMSKVIEVENLNKKVFNKAIYNLLERHESLRSTFIEVNQKIKLKTSPPHSFFPIEYLDVEEEGRDKIKVRIQEYCNKPFALNKGPLIKIKVFSLGSSKSLVLLLIDHIISDAWSLQVLEVDLMNIYNALMDEEVRPIPPLKIQFKDYIARQKKLLNDTLNVDFLYWQSKLSGQMPLINLAKDKENTDQIPHELSYKGGLRKEVAEHFSEVNEAELNELYGTIFSAKPLRGGAYRAVIKEDILRKIQKIAQETNTSLFAVLAASLNMFIYRITNQSDIIIGTPVSLRENESTYNLIGWFLDTLILRNKVGENSTIKELLAQVSVNLTEALAHREYPFERILNEFNIPFERVGKVLIHLLNFDTTKQFINDFEWKHKKSGTPTFDLNFTFAEYKNGIELVCDYRNELFDPEYIEKLVGEYLELIEFMVWETDKSIKDFIATLYVKSMSA